jgi:hypothetical protein
MSGALNFCPKYCNSAGSSKSFLLEVNILWAAIVPECHPTLPVTHANINGELAIPANSSIDVPGFVGIAADKLQQFALCGRIYPNSDLSPVSQPC